MSFLDTLKSLDAKATPGPWEVFDHDGPSGSKGMTQAEFLATNDPSGWASGCTAFGVLSASPEFGQVLHAGALYRYGRVRVPEERANVDLSTLLRNHAARIAALVEAANRWAESEAFCSCEDTDEGRALLDALAALDKEAP